MQKIHTPVLMAETLEYLGVAQDKNFIDCTVGEAGHTVEILKRNGPNGKVLGIDWDESQVKNSTLYTIDAKERVMLVCDSYVNITKIAQNTNIGPIHGILIDLGMSSWQLEGERGFTFLKDQPLDMRYSNATELTAKKIVNTYSENEIIEILEKFGEEKYARHIAKEITARRQRKSIETTFELIDIIKSAIPRRFQYGKIHVATKTFQALRIAVNSEMDNLEKFLPDATELLSRGGRLVVISFHSLEDRIVKNFFKKITQNGRARLLTKKPVGGNFEEIQKNPRARSAKLRAIEIS